MRELWDFLDVKATVWYHSCVCQQDRGYIGIWDSNNSLCHTHSITVTREEEFFFINNTMVIQIGTDEHSLQGRIVGFCGIVVITSKGFFYWFPKFLSNAKTRICIPAFCFCLSTLYGLTLLWPFFSPSWMMVPGYRQVSSRRKDLFCCFGSPVSVGSQGKGWGGYTTHLCLGLVWPLSFGHAPFHCSALLWDSFYTAWYDIRCPLPLEIHSRCTLRNSFSWRCTSIVIKHV